MKNKIYIRYFLLLQVVYFFFSLFGVCGKMAVQYPVFSLKFCLFYGISLLNLGVYAIIWQMILKRLPLVIAYSNKAVTLLWGLLWGRIFFEENITVLKIIGTVIACIGIIIVVTDGAEG